MSLFDKIFQRPKRAEVRQVFRTLTGYQPEFRRWHGRLYESDLVRAAIDARSRHISKLKIEIHGAAQPKLQTLLRKRPNQYQTWAQFLYRLNTILDMQNNALIVPIINRENQTTGFWACLPSRCRVLEDKTGKEWLEYTFTSGDRGAVELDRCGIMTKHQYESDFFGESNAALNELLDLISIERQGIKEAIKSSASFRFMARLTNFKDPEDVATEQKNFTERNLSGDKSGFLLFPNTYDGIQQIQSKPYTISAEEQEAVQRKVFDYFGVSEAVIRNEAAGSQLDAFFDGAIEPFAVQLSEVLTFMLFSDLEIGHGAKVVVSANRLQYMSTSDKVNFIGALMDRGVVTINEARELINYQPLPDDVGALIPIRGEFYFVGQEKEKPEELPEPEPEPEDKSENNDPEPPEEGEENGNQA